MRGEFVIAIIGGVLAFAFIGCVSKKTYNRDVEFAHSTGYIEGIIYCSNFWIERKKNVKPVEANPKGIRTPLTDGFNREQEREENIRKIKERTEEYKKLNLEFERINEQLRGFMEVK